MKLSSIQDLMSNIYEQNYFVERLALNLQGGRDVSWKKLKDICLNNPEAKLCAVLPTADTYENIFSPEQLKNFLDEIIKEKDSYQYSYKLWKIMNSNIFSLHLDMIETGALSTYLPVMDIYFNKKYILLCAKEIMSDSICDEINITHNTCYTGKSFIDAATRRESNGFCSYDSNPPCLFVEYIENIYFEKHNWTSNHPTERVVPLFNPASLGFNSLGFTPHY